MLGREWAAELRKCSWQRVPDWDPRKIILRDDEGPGMMRELGWKGCLGAQEPRWLVIKWVDQEAWRTSREGKELNDVSLKEQGLSQDEGEYRSGLGSQEDFRLTSPPNSEGDIG